MTMVIMQNVTANNYSFPRNVTHFVNISDSPVRLMAVSFMEVVGNFGLQCKFRAMPGL